MKVVFYIYALLDKKSKLFFWSTFLFTVLFSLSITIAPLILAEIISNMGMANHLDDYIVYILLYAIIMLLTKFCEIILNTSQGFLRVSLLKNISSSYLKAILSNPIEYLKDKNGGYICQMLTEASNDIYILIKTFSQGIVSPLLQLLFVSVICLTSDFPLVAMVFSIYIFLFFLTTIILNKRISGLRIKMMDSTVNSYMKLSDSVQNIVAIKKNNCLQSIEKRYDLFLDKEEKAQKRYWKKTFQLFSLSSSQSFVLFVFLFFYSVYSVIHGEMSIASFVLITSYINLFTSPVESMSNVISDVKRSYNSLSRFIDEHKEAEFIHAREYEIPKEKIEITCRNVSFSYSSGEKEILNNFNAVFKAGAFIAIRGDSGSGKTTLAQIITNYVSDYSGEIYFNSIPVKDISDDVLCELVYHVTQDDFIFMDSLRFNLSVANPLSTDADMLDSLRLACIDKINGENVSLDMQLQDSGDNISGGQKQRISIARLFLRNPKVIILDEATASLDKMNKKTVLNNIRSFFPDATIINISHDKDIWGLADFLYDLDELNAG